jgi:phosphatidate cytidylyltransferase
MAASSHRSRNPGMPAARAAAPVRPVLTRTGKARITIFVSIAAAVALLLAVDSVWKEGYVFAAGAAAVLAIAMAELATLATKAGILANRAFLVLVGVGQYLLQWAAWAWPQDFPDPWLSGTAVPVLTIMGLLTCRVVRGQVSGSLEGVAVTAAALLYVPLLLGFLLAVRMHWGVMAIVVVLAVTKAGSSGAYIVGKSIGRTPLAPAVSPRKTVEGAAGQIAGCMAVSYLLTLPSWGLMRPAAGIFYGLLAGLTGMFGDLAESVLKRQAGLKDSSQLLPAQGGILDTIDDVLFVAPVSYFFLLWCAPLFAGG